MFKKISRVICLSLLVSTMLVGHLLAENTYDYTLLIYMNGSDLESEYQSATDDLIEMLQGDIPANVAVVVETGGTDQWHTGDYGLPQISNEVNQRWQVTQDGLVLLESLESSNMGDAKTLENFLTYGMNEFDSDQYALIMWNHGAGSIYGYGADEHYDYDTLSLEEFQIALDNNYEATETVFDMVGFDACLMASVEVAHVLTPYADYLVGSEELEPAHGWHYTPIMDFIASDADPDPVELGEVIINGFIGQSSSEGTADAITASLIDLSQIDLVREALDQLLTRVRTDLADPSMSDNLLKARLEAESFGEGNDASDIPDSDMVDLIDYAIQVNAYYPYQAEELVLAVQEAVLYSINSDLTSGANGLSVYIPARDRETMSVASYYIRAIDFSEPLAGLIEDIDLIMNNNSTVLDYESVVTEEDAASLDLQYNNIEGDEQFFYFKVEPSELSSIDQIATLMGRVDDVGDIQYLASDLVPDEGILEDGLIVGGTLDYWVDINGVTTAMYYESHSDAGIKNYYVPIKLNDEDADLIVLFSASYPNGKILGARKLNNDNENVYNRSLFALEPEDRIDFICEYDSYNLIDSTYTYDGWYIIDSIYVGQGLELSWYPLEAGEYTYAFEITDIYGNIYQSDWISYIYNEAYEYTDTSVDQEWTASDDLQGDGSLSYDWLQEGVELPSEWAIPYVTTAYNNGLTTAQTLRDFDQNITREAFCELVVNMYEKTTGKTIAITTPKIFDDTDNVAIAKAYEIGVVSGYGNGNFGPEDEITREQLVTMFYRLLVKLDGKYGLEIHPAITFSDEALISSWAVDGVASLVDHRLIDGVGDNLLAPQNQATIEQSLKLVNGVYEFYIVDNR